MYRHPLLESLHICFTLPIVVLDNDLDMLKAYPFQQDSCLLSDLKPHLDKVWRQKSLFPFTLLRTPKGQMLALYPFQNYLFYLRSLLVRFACSDPTSFGRFGLYSPALFVARGALPLPTHHGCGPFTALDSLLFYRSSAFDGAGPRKLDAGDF